jgi:hypothetical protein
MRENASQLWQMQANTIKRKQMQLNASTSKHKQMQADTGEQKHLACPDA